MGAELGDADCVAVAVPVKEGVLVGVSVPLGDCEIVSVPLALGVLVLETDCVAVTLGVRVAERVCDDVRVCVAERSVRRRRAKLLLRMDKALGLTIESMWEKNGQAVRLTHHLSTNCPVC